MVKIGIRPTIDGREKGIRESLEEQTMRMAHAAARLISGNVKDEDGNAVECVLADGTIGGVAEAARCREKFEREGVCATLTVTPCWCYGSETMDMDPRTPKAVWGLNATERPGGGVPRGGHGGARAKGDTGLFYLRTGRAGRR